MRSILRNYGMVSLVAALVIVASGCAATTKPGTAENEKDKKDKDQVAKIKDKDQSAKKDDTSEDGWWCNDHGIPEKECSMCQADVEKACKAKGDWCAKHDRAKSQCFICDPSLKEKYAARYREHYNGKEPPAIKD